MVDIKLRQWAEQALPAKSVESGWEALQAEFNELIQKAKKLPDHDGIFDTLKASVVDESIKRHTWEDKVIQFAYRTENGCGFFLCQEWYP